MTALRTLEWVGDHQGHLRLIDQTLLPVQLQHRDCRTVEDVWEAIRQLRVRGAPAIGVTAAMGVVVGVREHHGSGREDFTARVNEVCDYLATSRPTAVNLFWALDRMKRFYQNLNDALSSGECAQQLLIQAQAIEEEDRATCRAIGAVGAALIQNGEGVLTHCNAGGLATADYGTALAVMFAAKEDGRQFSVYADETRPLLQGSRLTAWELQQRDIDVTLICDNMAAQVMKEGRIQRVIVGADRIAANGDAANKIGTYGVALLAKAHEIPFYVAAPSSTFDLTLKTGDEIPIEQRESHEVTHGFGKQTAPDAVKVYNPAFDVTPNHLITGIITEKGLIQPVNADNVWAMVGQ